MQVRVLFFGILKEITGRAEEVRDIAAGSTLETLFEEYSARFETLRGKRSSILFARNREFAKPNTLLAENDEVAFLPPVSGGSHGHRFHLTRDRIDAAALARELQRGEDGAVIVFEGIVRNNTKGRPTLHLEYECYEPLALAQMTRIGQEIAAQHDIGSIGMVHRLGRLEIGEASVAIVATAPHRRAAFEAALDGINRLKREVPVWKKEYFADGAVWVDGEWDDKLIAAATQNEGT